MIDRRLPILGRPHLSSPHPHPSPVCSPLPLLLPHQINMVVGGSVLALPKVFASCGLALGAACLALCAACTVASLRLLVLCAARTGAARYEQAAGIAFGTAGRRLAEAWLVMLQLGCLVGSLNILADVVSPLVRRGQRKKRPAQRERG